MNPKDYSAEPTESLFEHFDKDNNLDFGIVQELIKREDSLDRLAEYLVIEQSKWRLLMDSMHIMAAKKNKLCIDTVLYGIVNQQYMMGDYLTENTAGLLSNFGPEILDRLELMFLFPWLDKYVKSEVLSAMAIIASDNPAQRQRVLDFHKKVMEMETNAFLIFTAVDNVVELNEHSFKPIIEKLISKQQLEEYQNDFKYALDTLDGKNKNELSTFAECKKKFQAYLKPENFLNRFEDSEEENPKTRSYKPGRNEPCPCGSGKKYKKCCLGKYE